MRKLAVVVAVVVMTGIALPVLAAESQKPESIAEKMAFKFARGVTNLVTSPGELYRQTVLTTRNHGDIGYVIGPLKGIGMTFYRAFIGATETIFFLVPQPGYYDPMMEPEFVWQNWDDPRLDPQRNGEPVAEAPAGK
ncbi:MAG TPA: exosortase system-associated protein, TIGR04073 family [Geobacteraceae bacterium]